MRGMTRLRPLFGMMIVLAGCGEPATPATANDTATAPGPPEVRTVTTIDIDAGTRRWTARIVDSPTARDLLAQLPLELALEDYAQTEKIATLPRKLIRDGAPAAVTPRRGEIGYYAPWGNIAIYHKDGPYSPSLIILGRMDEPFADLARLGRVKVTIRRR